MHKRYYNLEKGTKFSKWTVIGEEVKQETKAGYAAMHLCRCICGTERLVRKYALVGNKSKGCGCDNNKDKEGIQRLVLEPGQIFGKLVVEKFDHSERISTKNKSTKPFIRFYYKCKCNCGKRAIINSANLKSGNSKSCGCIRSPDLTGQKFGMLTAIEFSHKGNMLEKYYLCKCRCGKKTTLRRSHLGITQSCGCLVSNNSSPEEAVMRGFMLGAKKRKYKFELSISDVKSIITTDCHYCGSKPDKRKDLRGEHLLYTGIDRQDNSKGYIEGNCVSCCSMCNLMKGKYAKAAFLKHAKKIARFNRTLPNG